jgi:dephospho-CoA kinase
MGLFYITGVAGSGKSAVEKELRRLGYEAHDVDDPSVGAPYNNRSNAAVLMPPAIERTPEWFAAHSWRISRKRIEMLKERSKDRAIFVCGTASNEQGVWSLFDKVLCLDIDEAILRSRIASRTDNDFGQTEQELQMILQRYKSSRDRYASSNMTIVDATKPLSDVVDLILKYTRVAS